MAVDGCTDTDDRRRPGRSLMAVSRYTETTRGVCAAASLTNSEQMNVCRPGGGKEQRNRVSQRLTASIVEGCETSQSVSN